MKERKLINTGSIDISTLENLSTQTDISPSNEKIILEAAAMPNFEEALSKLDNIKLESKKIWVYYLLDKQNIYLREGVFEFLWRVLKGLIGEDEAINKLTGYGSITDKLLEQMNEKDAIKVCVKQLNWATGSGLTNETSCAISYLLSLEKEGAVALLKSVFSDGSMSYHTIISLISIYINREDVASEFKFVDKLHEYLRMYADMNVIGAIKMIESFDYKNEEASSEQVEMIIKMVDSKKDGIHASLSLMCLTSFDKSEFIAKFSAMFLTNIQKITDGQLCYTAKSENFDLLGVDINKFIDFVSSFKNTEKFLIQSNEDFVKYFAEDNSLDKNCLINHIESLDNIKTYKDFITEKADLSNTNIILSDELRKEARGLESILNVYKSLFGNSDQLDRIKFLIHLHFSFYNLKTEIIEKLKEYNINDFSLSLLTETLSNGNIINNFNKAALTGKASPKIDLIVSLFKGRTELINTLMKNYKDRSIEVRVLLVLVLGDNLDTHFDTFSKINENSKAVQSAIAKVYRDNPSLAEKEIIKLKDKKQATRKAAFTLLKMAYGSKYNEQIEEAMNLEPNEKLKLQMQDHLNSMDDIDENNVNITKVVETLIKNRKKVEFAYQNMPEVHDLNGNVASEEYLTACLVAYANEPIAGVSVLGKILASNLNEKEFASFALQAYYNFIDDGAEAKKKWVLYFASIHGGFDMIEILKSQIAKWAESMRGAIAGEATKALALNKAPLALLIVDGMSRKYKFKQVKNAAVDAMEFAADQLKITKEELSDRIVPNLGFDESMKIVFDYGARKFDVYLNTALELEVFDGKGKKIKSLPAVGKSDDEAIGGESLKRFKELKKQLKATVTTQRDRLDMALADGRKWRKEAYENLFVKNPIMHQFAIGLVWGIYEDGILLETFRYMEDGSFNSSEEDEVTITENAAIGIVHPLEMDDELLSTWKEQLSDYEVIQPLVQLERVIYNKKDDELNGKEATEMAGKVISPATLSNKILAQGFIRGDIMDAGFFSTFIKVNDGLDTCAELVFSGTSVGYYDDGPSVTKEIKFFKKEYLELGEWGRKENHYMNISEVDEKLYSETLSAVEKATLTSTEFNENWREEN